MASALIAPPEPGENPLGTSFRRVSREGQVLVHSVFTLGTIQPEPEALCELPCSARFPLPRRLVATLPQAGSDRASGVGFAGSTGKE